MCFIYNLERNLKSLAVAELAQLADWLTGKKKAESFSLFYAANSIF